MSDRPPEPPSPAPADDAPDPTTAAARISALSDNLCRVIVGKAEAIGVLLDGLVGGGHVLLDDIPGVGKTTLAKALARSIGGRFSRIQFTPDLLPLDIVGASIYSQTDGEFHFRPGPIFGNILLADEINRASPRTQSALLEAMGERQVTVDGKSLPLEAPFFVIATQNPVDSHGTYPLPEAQLDRFAVQLSLGYPPADEEQRILLGAGGTQQLSALEPVLDPIELAALQGAAARVRVEPSVVAYLHALVAATRAHPSVRLGVSPRGALAALATARARALAAGRNYVLPDDVRRVALPTMAHRLVLDSKARYAGIAKEALIEQVVGRVAVPR